MLAPLTALVGVTAFTMLLVLFHVRASSRRQQRQLDAVIDAVNALEVRMSTPPRPPQPGPQPPALPPQHHSPPAPGQAFLPDGRGLDTSQQESG